MAAPTMTLVSAGKNNLRYLFVQAGADATAGVITNTGGVTPDLLTNSAGFGGTIRKMALQFTTGYGKLAAGALTQAQARAIYNNDDPTGVVGPANIPRAQCLVTQRSGATNDFIVDVNVDGAGKATITVTPGAATAYSAYVDVMVPGTIGY